MASDNIKAHIKNHLAKNGAQTWARTIDEVAKEINMGSRFVEDAMKDLVERGELRRLTDGTVPRYEAPGKIEGKYASINDKRLEGMETVTINDGWDKNPYSKSINSPEAI